MLHVAMIDFGSQWEVGMQALDALVTAKRVTPWSGDRGPDRPVGTRKRVPWKR